MRADAYDELTDAEAGARTRTQAFRHIAVRLATHKPAAGGHEAAYRSAQAAARAAVRRHPHSAALDEELHEPAEPATTWWCERCGGIAAPQRYLGICIWRPVDRVNRTSYQRQRKQAIAELERERRLRQLLQRLANVTPHADKWERNWHCLQADARAPVAGADEATP
jgi:hypothetical protein